MTDIHDSMSGPEQKPLNSSGLPELVGGGGVPPMVSAAQSHGDYPIQVGPQLTLGLKLGGSRKRFYFLASSRSDVGRYRRKFPISEDGWREAWHAFATEDPLGAAAYRGALQRRAGHALREADRLELARQGAERLAQLPQIAEVAGCTLIGGYQYDRLTPANGYDLHFADDRVLITPSATTAILVELEYAEVLALRVDGPGAITRGGGFIGGGFGLAGAAEGMVIASVLNALTTRTTIQTIVEVQDRARDFLFFYENQTPEQLRLRLRPVEARLRQLADERDRQQRSQPVSGPDPVERLERLAQLHKQGALTDDEFAAAKRKLLTD